MHTHLHTYIHTYIHTHIHAYIHIDRHRVCSLAKCNNAKHHFMDGWMYYAAKRRKAMRYQAMRHDVNANIYSLQQTAVHAYIYTYIHTYISICANTLSTEYIYLYIYIYIYTTQKHAEIFCLAFMDMYAWHRNMQGTATAVTRAPANTFGAKQANRATENNCIHTYRHTYIHTYIHANIHTYIYCRRLLAPLLQPSTQALYCSSLVLHELGIDNSESWSKILALNTCHSAFSSSELRMRRRAGRAGGAEEAAAEEDADKLGRDWVSAGERGGERERLR